MENTTKKGIDFLNLSFIGSQSGLMKYIGEEICEFCYGTGEVSCDERDSEGNWESGTGTRICECRLDDEIDMSGSSNDDR